RIHVLALRGHYRFGIEAGHLHARHGPGEIVVSEELRHLLRVERERLGIEHVSLLVHPPRRARLRSAAAATARARSGGRPVPSCISTASAAAVVPPGLVTSTRNCAGELSEDSASAPAPATVARARCRATS